MNKFLQGSAARASMEAFLGQCGALASPDDFPPQRLPHMHALDHMFFCESCKDVLDCPRVLKCGHSFCYKCLLGLLNSAHAMQSKQKGNHDANRCCPTCKQSFEGDDWTRQNNPHFERILGAYKRARKETVKLVRKAITAGLCDGASESESSSSGDSSGDSSGSSDQDDGVDEDDNESRNRAGSSASSSNTPVIDITDQPSKRPHEPTQVRHDLQRPQYKSKALTQAKLVQMMLDKGLIFAKELNKPGDLGQLQHYHERYRIEHNAALEAVRVRGGERCETAAMTDRAYARLCQGAASAVRSQFADFTKTDARQKRVKTNKEGEAALAELRKKGGATFAENQKKLEQSIRRRQAGEKKKTQASFVKTADMSAAAAAAGKLPTSSPDAFPSGSSSSSPYHTLAAAVRRSWRVTWSKHAKRWFYYHVASRTGQWNAPPAFYERRDVGVQTLPAPKELAAAVGSLRDECIVIDSDEEGVREKNKNETEEGVEGGLVAVAAAAAAGNKQNDLVGKTAGGPSSGRGQQGSASGRKRKRKLGVAVLSTGKKKKAPSKSSAKKGRKKTESNDATGDKAAASYGEGKGAVERSKSSRTTMTSSFKNCPVCNKEIYSRLLRAHVNECLEKSM